MLQQALRDVSAWAEKGIEPPPGTEYRIIDGQVLVPGSAANRKGIQPVVTLAVNGGERAEVTAGETVSFTGTIAVPPGAGSVVNTEWDFDGAGTFPVSSPVPDGASEVSVSITHKFNQPGNYFPVLRGVSRNRSVVPVRGGSQGLPNGD